MGRQPQDGERHGRSTLRAESTPSTASAAGSDGATRRARLARYGLRALLVAGAAGAVWLLSSQAASAQQANTDATQPTATHAEASCPAGLLPAVGHRLGDVTEALTGSGGQRAAGDRTCDPAGSHDATARPQTAQVANSTGAANQATPSAVTAASNTTVAAGGVHRDTSGTLPTRRSTVSAASTPAAIGAGETGQSTPGLLAGATGPVLGPVLDATRPVTEPLHTAVRPIVRPSQGPTTDVLGGVLRPATTTLTDSTSSVTGALTGPLVAATRPVTGLLSAAVHPLPGVTGAATAPLTGVLTGTTGPLSGLIMPTGPTPSQASGHPAGTMSQDLSLIRQVSTAQYWAGPLATWAGHRSAPAERSADAGHPAPGVPEPTPLPVYPGSGLSSGSMGTSAAQAAGGAFALTTFPVVSDDSASRVGPGTTSIGLPRLAEVDPVVTPD